MTYFRIRWGDGTRLFRVDDTRPRGDPENCASLYFLGSPLDPSTGQWSDARQRVYCPDVVDWNAKW